MDNIALNFSNAYKNTINMSPNKDFKPSQPEDSVSISQEKKYAPDELIVKFKKNSEQLFKQTKIPGQNGVSAEIIKTFDLGPKSKAINDDGDLCHIKLSGITVEKAIEMLQDDSRIAYAEPNYALEIPVDLKLQFDATKNQTFETRTEIGINKPNDLDSRLWNLNNEGQSGGLPGADIDALKAWSITTGKKEGGPLIGVADSGLEYDHPDIKDNLWTNPDEIAGDGVDNDCNGYIDDVHGYNFYGQNSEIKDNHGHGTHCAGVIGAKGNNGLGVTGINWDAQIMTLKIMDPKEKNGYIGATIDAIAYATQMGVKILSNSWGSDFDSKALEEAISKFPGLFIASAGNAEKDKPPTDNDKVPHFPSGYDFPNIISVASSDSGDKLSATSNYGVKTVDIAAPGVEIGSTIPGGTYGYMSGTSMAVPHVSGVAALIMSEFPELSVLEVKEAILKGGDRLEGLDDKVATGMRLNAYGALQVAAEIQKSKEA